MAVGALALYVAAPLESMNDPAADETGAHDRCGRRAYVVVEGRGPHDSGPGLRHACRTVSEAPLR